MKVTIFTSDLQNAILEDAKQTFPEESLSNIIATALVREIEATKKVPVPHDVPLINMLQSISSHLAGIKTILRSGNEISNHEHFILMSHAESAHDRAERSVEVLKGIKGAL